MVDRLLELLIIQLRQHVYNIISDFVENILLVLEPHFSLVIIAAVGLLDGLLSLRDRLLLVVFRVL